jgi:hypothetical protein
LLFVQQSPSTLHTVPVALHTNVPTAPVNWSHLPLRQVSPLSQYDGAAPQHGSPTALHFWQISAAITAMLMGASFRV